MNNIQEIALELIEKNIGPNTTIQFKDRWFTFYIDTCGQRGHCIIPYNPYGLKKVPNVYTILRVLSFENDEDKGKDGAILGVIDFSKCKALSILDNKIEFENFTIDFERNPHEHKANKFYERENKTSTSN